MLVKQLPVADLKEYGQNSRTHSTLQVGQIAESIKAFGWTNPLLVDESRVLIAGHGRLAAAKLLGLAEVPCIEIAGLSEDKRRALVIADNKLALNAGWDDAALASEIALLNSAGFDLDLLGFTAAEMNKLQDFDFGGDSDPDEVPPVPDDPTSAPGDLWVLGKHRLMCGDSTSMDAVIALVPGGGIDMFLTDPPYNLAYEGKTADALTIQNDSMSNTSFRQFLRDAFTAADSVMKAGAVFYIWYADVESYNFTGALVDTGWDLRQVLIWKKNSLVMGRKDYHFKHEACLYGWKDGAGHLWASDRKQTTILEFDRPTRSLDHPTMKPVALFEYQLLNNTKGGDLCLDLFGGSGTTLIACEKNGRYARLMELDPKYCDVIVRRWQAFTGKQATLESSGATFEQVAADRKT
jgi:DNA modification methylase